MGITIQQLSVFLENREGRLDEVLSVLAGNDVNIVALSLADTTEYGMLRMIVSDPNKGKAVLKENGITAMLTDVIALRVPHETGSLSRAMHQIVDGDVNIEYMYAFANGEDASAVLKCDDPAACFTRIPAGLACIPSGSVTTYLNSFILLVLLNDFIVLLLYFLQYITYSLIFQSFCHTFINHPLTFAVNHAKLSRY